MRRVIAATTLATLLAARLGAQVRPGPTTEWRAETVIGNGVQALGGFGVALPVGTYVRLAGIGSAGVRFTGETSLPMGRAEVMARFLLDPFRESRRGLSIGAGGGLVLGEGRPRAVLLIALELEGERRASGWVPALQAGLGDGARIALVLRRGSRRWR